MVTLCHWTLNNRCFQCQPTSILMCCKSLFSIISLLYALQLFPCLLWTNCKMQQIGLWFFQKLAWFLAVLFSSSELDLFLWLCPTLLHAPLQIDLLSEKQMSLPLLMLNLSPLKQISIVPQCHKIASLNGLNSVHWESFLLTWYNSSDLALR